MIIASRFRDWCSRLNQRRTQATSPGALREFVYLDDVSVYSILASRTEGIVTELTEVQNSSLNSDISSSFGLGLGANKASLNAKVQAGNVHGSQVLRKTIIQTSFKELYNNERKHLVLSPPDASDQPPVKVVADLKDVLKSSSTQKYVIDANSMRRGDLLEVNVRLEAEPIFRVSAIITSLSELLEDKDDLFDPAIIAQLANMRSIAKILESLLAGLVPIRGCLVDYRSARIDGKDALIHRLLLDQILLENQIETYPVFVVGVAQNDLFWKDIRRVLFSGAEYTVFCRLAVNGLIDRWQPVKLAGVLGGIAPAFDEAVKEFHESARLTMNMAPRNSQADGDHKNARGTQVIKMYAALLGEHHGNALEPAFIDNLIEDISLEDNWLDSVDSVRRMLGTVTRRVDRELGVQTSNDTAYGLRSTARANLGLDDAWAKQGPIEVGRDGASADRPEKFLDAEIVAIYW